MPKRSILDNPVISKVVFYPRKTPIPKNLPDNVKILRIKQKDGETTGAAFYVNNNDYPTILLFHGNGEVALDYLHFIDLFFDCGVNLVVADFRGYGFSSGKPYYTSLLKDAMPIFNYIRNWLSEQGFRDSIFVQGRSLGSACASEIGSNQPSGLKGVIFESAFASIYNMMTRLFRVASPELTPTFLSKFSNDVRLRLFKAPVLIIHGSSDWIIPHSEANLIYQNLPDNINKKLITIEGAGHNNIFSYEKEYFGALEKFIKEFQ